MTSTAQRTAKNNLQKTLVPRTMNQMTDDQLPEIQPNHPLDGLLPGPIHERLMDAMELQPDLFELPEDELEALLASRQRKRPGHVENQLRLRFWYEINLQLAQKNPGPIEASRVCAGVCSTAAFYAYISRPEGAAWLACMPTSLDNHLEEMVNYGQAWERKVVRLDAMGGGKPDTKLMKLQYEIIQDAKLRKLGAIATKEMVLHAHVGKASAEGAGERAIDTKVKELLGRQARKVNPPRSPDRPIIELEPEADE